MFKSKFLRSKEMSYNKFRILTIVVLFSAIIIGTQVAYAEKDDRVKLETELVNESTNDNGHAVFEKRTDRNTLKVEIENQKASTTFRILVDGIQVGSIITDTAGAGGTEMDSRKGTSIPPVKSGSKIEIIESSSVILSGIFGGNVGVAANTPPASPVTTTSVTIPLGAKDKTVTEFFSPHTIQVNQLDTVIWTNKDNTAHTVSGSSFDSGLISPGQTFSHKFSENGTFDYACQLHSWMTGQVIVGTGGPIIAQPSTNPSTNPSTPTPLPNISPQTKISIPVGAADKKVTEFFTPKSLPVKINDVITWINNDSAIHTVTSGDGTKDGLFDSGFIQAGKSFSFSFTKSGTFDYFCQVHPWMTGQVVVDNNGISQSSPVPTPSSISPAKNSPSNNTSTSKVSIPLGAADKKVTEYFVPNTITIKNQDSVIWTNTDSAAHTVTSGLADKGSDGVFDSGLIAPGKSFTFQFTKVGTVDYFCMVHPWMTGIVTVQANGEIQNNSQLNDSNVSATGMLSDGTKISVSASAPVAGETMTIAVSFAGKVHVNEDITVTQNQDTVLDEKGVHANEGKTTYQTVPLSSTDPVKIIVTFQGYGIDDPKTGPIGEKVVFSNVVPEFGTISIMILVVSIISIVITTKIRTIPRF
jgi:predicted secreted protein with PEFG-CTERM motif